MTYPYSPKGFSALIRPNAPRTATPSAMAPSQVRTWTQDGAQKHWGETAEWLPYYIQGQMGGLANSAVDNLYGADAGYQNARRGAINALSPGNAQNLIDIFRRRQMASAMDTGRQNAAMLRAQGITGADAGAMLDAQNRAADATNDYSAQINDPAAIAERLQAIMGLESPQAVAPILQLIMSLNGAVQDKVGMNDAKHAASASSGLGGIFGNILGMATGGGFGNLANIFGRRPQQAPSVSIPSYY